MYQPTHFKEERPQIQHALIRSHPFGLLVSAGPDGPEANGIPFLLDAAAGSHGILTAHIARANSQWKTIHAQHVLAIFQGPQAYISPSHYETKRQTGKVVPTWNYVMVQVRGTAIVHDNRDWLLAHVNALTNRHEEQRSQPWSVSDAPPDYIESQLRGIVGIEVIISHIDAKWKVSQNRPPADQSGVADGLDAKHPDMAALVRIAKS